LMRFLYLKPAHRHVLQVSSLHRYLLGLRQLICQVMQMQQRQGRLKFGIPSQRRLVVFWRVTLKRIAINFLDRDLEINLAALLVLV
jgi:hypothetical protein